MILKINNLSIDSISGVLFIVILSSFVIFPQALGFSKQGRRAAVSFSIPSIRLFQLKTASADMRRSVEQKDDSINPNESMGAFSTANIEPRDQHRERFFASLPQLKFLQKKLWIGDEVDRDILKTTFPNMLYYIVVPIVASVDTFWVGRLGDALALAGQGKDVLFYENIILHDKSSCSIRLTNH